MDDAGLAVDQTVCGPLGVCVLWAYGRHLTPMLATALAPLAVAADVAGVSSSCDVLYQRINGLRLHWGEGIQEASEIHTRTWPLLFTLERLNTRQGLGYTDCDPTRL